MEKGKSEAESVAMRGGKLENTEGGIEKLEMYENGGVFFFCYCNRVGDKITGNLDSLSRPWGCPISLLNVEKVNCHDRPSSDLFQQKL